MAPPKHVLSAIRPRRPRSISEDVTARGGHSQVRDKTCRLAARSYFEARAGFQPPSPPARKGPASSPEVGPFSLSIYRGSLHGSVFFGGLARRRRLTLRRFPLFFQARLLRALFV